MINKLKRQKNYLQGLIRIRDNWEFYTRDSWGHNLNQVGYVSASGEEIFTKEKLLERIDQVKRDIKKGIKV